MKDEKFMELLNLYIDHEISAADAALLEIEIARSPERLRVYRQYCQMQKACTVLVHDFRAEETAAGSKVLEFPTPPRTSRNWAFGIGLAAAAACAAFVFVSRDWPAEDRVMATDQVAVIPEVRSGISASPQQRQSVASRPALQSVFAGLVDSAEGEGTLAGATAEQLDWMNRMQLQRVAAEDLRFEIQPALKPDVRTFRSRQPLKGQVELTAFRFQR